MEYDSVGNRASPCRKNEHNPWRICDRIRDGTVNELAPQQSRRICCKPKHSAHLVRAF